jgi:hypothetical protein
LYMPQYILPASSIRNHTDILVKKQSVKVNMPAHPDIWSGTLWWDYICSPWDDLRWEDVPASLTCRHWQNDHMCTSFRQQHAVNQRHGTQVRP